MEVLELQVSELVDLLNQTLEHAFPHVIVVGELANFRVSKNKWLYFDLKDESSILRCFGTVYQLPGPLEDGMMLKVSVYPRIHPLYGFSLQVTGIAVHGEGSIKRAASLLEAKLAAEGLFNIERKRPLPYPPARVGLITSGESAAYHDFIKVLNERWAGVEVCFIDVQVQGQYASSQIVAALEQLSSQASPVDIVVLTRGGGSAEDLATFSAEAVTRAVAASRIPTLVAIGHEVDISLSELAADQRASTPSNAAQLLVPDKRFVLKQLQKNRQTLGTELINSFAKTLKSLEEAKSRLQLSFVVHCQRAQQALLLKQQLLNALNPESTLQRGYAVVRSTSGKVIKSVQSLTLGQLVELQMMDGTAEAKVSSKSLNK